jgi:uncharacterized protein (DUF2384 family)
VGAKEAQILEAAIRVFRTRQAAKAFLEVPSPKLGGSPAELIESGREDEVLALLDQLEREAPAEPSSMARLFSGWLGRFGRR